MTLTYALADVRSALDLACVYAESLESARANLEQAVRYRDDTVRKDAQRGEPMWSPSHGMTWAAFWRRRVDVLSVHYDHNAAQLEAAKERVTAAAREYGRALVEAECGAVTA